MKRTIKMPRSAVRHDGSHDTEVSSYDEDGYDALCSCGWDTLQGRITTEEAAQLAADEHVRVEKLLADPAVAHKDRRGSPLRDR